MRLNWCLFSNAFFKYIMLNKVWLLCFALSSTKGQIPFFFLQITIWYTIWLSIKNLVSSFKLLMLLIMAHYEEAFYCSQLKKYLATLRALISYQITLCSPNTVQPVIILNCFFFVASTKRLAGLTTVRRFALVHILFASQPSYLFFYYLLFLILILFL